MSRADAPRLPIGGAKYKSGMRSSFNDDLIEAPHTTQSAKMIWRRTCREDCACIALLSALERIKGGGPFLWTRRGSAISVCPVRERLYSFRCFGAMLSSPSIESVNSNATLWFPKPQGPLPPFAEAQPYPSFLSVFGARLSEGDVQPDSDHLPARCDRDPNQNKPA